MDTGGLILPETTTTGVGGGGGMLKGEKVQKMPMAGSAVRRKRLSDITNIAGGCRQEVPGAAADQENFKSPPISASTQEYIAQLLKENTALMRLVAERNKVIEMSGAELQKLRLALQKANQQNWQLAQANSQMLAELNLGKDRLKAMHHELGCTMALLKARTAELEEKKRSNRQLPEKITAEGGSTECIEVIANTSRPASPVKACNPSRKRSLKNQSMGSTAVTHQASVKEKDESRRRSLRRRSINVKSEPLEPTEDVFEIEDVKFPICSVVSDPMHEDASTQPESSLCSNAHLKPVKDEVQRGRSCSPQSQNLEERRTSVGRPLRKAAEKIGSYKEIPINVKMRRNS